MGGYKLFREDRSKRGRGRKEGGEGVAQKCVSPSVGQTTVWLRVHSLASKERQVRETQWQDLVTVHLTRVRKWMKLF